MWDGNKKWTVGGDVNEYLYQAGSDLVVSLSSCVCPAVCLVEAQKSAHLLAPTNGLAWPNEASQPTNLIRGLTVTATSLVALKVREVKKLRSYAMG